MNKQIIFIIALSLFVLSGCVKIQFKPQELVSDTVSATKDLYETVKRKRDGTEERLYTHTVAISSDVSAEQATTECFAFINSALSEDDTKNPKLLEQGTEILDTESGQKLKCSILAVV